MGLGRASTRQFGQPPVGGDWVLPRYSFRPHCPTPISVSDFRKFMCVAVLLCFIDPRVRRIRSEASSCPGIFSGTLRFYYVASSPGSPLPHLLDGHRKLVRRSAIPTR